MVVVFMVAVTVFCWSLASGGCMTIKGIAQDLKTGSTVVVDTLTPIEEKMKQDEVERAAKMVLNNQNRQPAQ